MYLDAGNVDRVECFAAKPDRHQQDQPTAIILFKEIHNITDVHCRVANKRKNMAA